MFGCTPVDIINLFIGLPVPATEEQVLGEGMNRPLRYRIFYSALGAGSIVRDGDKFRLGEEALHKEKETVNDQLKPLQERMAELERLSAQSE